MKGRMILLDHLNGREAAALMVDGQLDDLLIDDDRELRPGAILRATCDRPLKGQGGMMLRLPGGSGFLRQGKGLAPGQTLLVQVTGYPDGGKATPVTDRLLFKSRYAIATPGAPGLNISRAIKDDDERDRLKGIALDASEGGGLILRSAAAGADADEIAEDIAETEALATAILTDADGPPEALTEGDSPHALAWRDWVAPADIVTEPGCFDTHGVLDALEALKSPEVPLGAGWMAVEPTRALVAVDVNTGGDMSPAAGLKANLEAVQALPRALRLRGLGGQVVVDMAPMSKGQRRQVEAAVRAAFRADTVDTAFVGWTPLGHLELQRKRERVPTRALL